MSAWHVLVPFVALLSLAFAPTAAQACSTREGYRVPTNFELVEKASLIVLARVVDGPDEPFGSEPIVTIEPVRVLKGALPGGRLKLMGSIKWNGEPVVSMPTPLSTAHVSASMGACVRLMYPKGGLIVAMFQRTEPTDKHAFPASMTPLFQAFARTAEDVESEDGVWVKAVETYAAVQAGVGKGAGKDGLRATAEAKRVDLLARTGDLAAQAMAADLAYYLDMTGSGEDRRADALRWTMIDTPDEVGAILNSRTQKGRILRCRAGGSAIEFFWPEEDGVASAFRIGEESFALVPADLTLSDDMKSRSATAPLDGRLRKAMMTATGAAGLDIPGRAMRAPPLDVLQKFALRCGALLAEGGAG